MFLVPPHHNSLSHPPKYQLQLQLRYPFYLSIIRNEPSARKTTFILSDGCRNRVESRAVSNRFGLPTHAYGRFETPHRELHSSANTKPQFRMLRWLVRLSLRKLQRSHWGFARRRRSHRLRARRESMEFIREWQCMSHTYYRTPDVTSNFTSLLGVVRSRPLQGPS